MKKDRIILLVYHGQGHFNACFKIAKILSEKYDVWFAGYAYFERYVVAHGFQFYSLTTVPFGLGFESWLNKQEGKRNIWWQNIKDRWSDRLYHLREQSLGKMVQDLSPAYILIDSWQSTDFIVLYPALKTRAIKTGFIQTMLSTVVGTQPPLTSAMMPGEKTAIDREIKKFYLQRYRSRLFSWCKNLGKDNDTIINRRIKVNNIPKEYLSRYKSLFSKNFDNIPEFILSPIELEFRNFIPLPHQQYVGSMLDEARVEWESTDFKTASSEIFSKSKERPLLYCSFGSTDLEEAGDVKNFLKLLIQIVNDKKYLCVVSCASKDILESAHDKSPHIFAFQNVPQLKILRHAKVFITHGGLNSIKEAINAEIPMLVYPIRPNADNFGNAARVAYHELGLCGNLTKDSIAQIDEKIGALLNNEMYRNNLKKFNSLSNGYPDINFLKLFESIPKIT
jgi:zeaxanthin glucosyltransferase